MSWTRFSSIIFRNVVDREEGSRLGTFAVAGVLFLTAFRSPALLLPEGAAALCLPEGAAALRLTEGAVALRLTEGVAALRLTEGVAALRLTEGDAALAVTFIALLWEDADDFVLDVLDERLATAVELFFIDFPAISGLLFSRNRNIWLLSPTNMNAASHRFTTPKLQKIAVQS